MKTFLGIFSFVVYSSYSLAVAPPDVQTIVGAPLPNCTSTQTVEAHVKFFKMIPEAPINGGFHTSSEAVCEFNMKMNLKADGKACSQIPPGEKSCKFNLNGKPEEVYPSFRYQTFDSGNKGNSYQFAASGDVAIVNVDVMATSKSVEPIKDSLDFSLPLAAMPAELHSDRYFVYPKLSQDQKEKKEGLRAEIMITHGKL